MSLTRSNPILNVLRGMAFPVLSTNVKLGDNRIKQILSKKTKLVLNS